MAEYASLPSWKRKPYNVRVIVENVRISVNNLTEINAIAKEIGIRNIDSFSYDSKTQTLEFVLKPVSEPVPKPYKQPATPQVWNTQEF